MARARNIKHGFFTNDRLAECEPLARLLFAGLWTIADREGRLEDRPKRIKAELLPYDECNGDALLAQLADTGFIIRYKVGGNNYIQITNFLKHQNPHVKEAASTIPSPEETVLQPVVSEQEEGKHQTSTVQAPDKHQTSTVLSRLIPDSLPLIPDSGIHSVGGITRTHPFLPADDDFPYADSPLDDRPRLRMTPDWQPSPVFLTERAGYGFNPATLTPENLAEFRGFWSAKTDRLTQAEWEHRLAVRLKEISSRPPARDSPRRSAPKPDDFRHKDYSVGINADGSF